MPGKRTILNYAVVIESCEEGGYFAQCPSLPGCHVQGETLEETLKEIKLAMKAYLDDVKSCHEHMPNPEHAVVTTIPISL